MRKIVFSVVPAFIVLSGCVHQPPAPPVTEPPKTLFAMFQKYCAATGAEREAMAKALTGDGYVDRSGQSMLRQILDIQSVSWQKGKDIVSWGPLTNTKITADGKKETTPLEPAGAKGEWCSIRVQREQEDSQAAVAKWAGVPVAHSPRAAAVGDEISDLYSFRLDDGKHIAGSYYNDRSAEAAVAGTWSLALYKRGKEYELSMGHIYVPENAKAP